MAATRPIESSIKNQHNDVQSLPSSPLVLHSSEQTTWKLRSDLCVPRSVSSSTTRRTSLALPAVPGLARAVFDRTYWYRRKRNHRPDRVEVVTLPLPQSFTDAERAEACVRHYEEELRSRLLIPNVAEAVSWFLPGRIMESTYARRILPINRLEENDNDDEVEVASWEESISNEEYAIEHEACMNPEASRSGSFLCIDWQPRKELWLSHRGLAYDPDKDKEIRTPCYGFEIFGNICMELVDAVEVFYNHFVPDGVLDLELDKAR
ncbi:hypothetical protein K456DRAFT_1918770 [Colletotrichum gloeosporioides 23]|nr:hypothetical protein K456DRAFT_1918770 [Colletotrichum gloeosporioides 23]